MSKKNRKQAAARKVESPPTQPPALAPQDPPKPTKQPTNWVAWLALLVSFYGAVGATYNLIIASRNYERQAGRVRAKLDVVDALPSQQDVPPQLLQMSPMFKEPMLTLNEPDDFFRLNPLAILKNVGDEPISEIRLETRMGFSFIDMLGEPEERQRLPTPWALEDATREDFLLGQKLMPGKSVEVSIVKGLIQQMVQLQATDRADRWHYGQFEIRCMARLVNGVAFDGAADDGRYSVQFRWQPKNFPEDKCKAILEKLKHFPVETRFPTPNKHGRRDGWDHWEPGRGDVLFALTGKRQA